MRTREGCHGRDRARTAVREKDVVVLINGGDKKRSGSGLVERAWRWHLRPLSEGGAHLVVVLWCCGSVTGGRGGCAGGEMIMVSCFSGFSVP
jgi:hypothetical protein